MTAKILPFKPRPKERIITPPPSSVELLTGHSYNNKSNSYNNMSYAQIMYSIISAKQYS